MAPIPELRFSSTRQAESALREDELVEAHAALKL